MKPPGRPWEQFPDPLKTVMSFINCWKYPPSLLYILMTLGPGIAFLGLFDRPVGLLGKFFVTFGRVPLFYYLLHIPLIHGAMIAVDYWRYGQSQFVNPGSMDTKGEPPRGIRAGLAVGLRGLGRRRLASLPDLLCVRALQEPASRLGVVELSIARLAALADARR